MPIRILSMAVLAVALAGPAAASAQDDDGANVLGRMMAGRSAVEGAELKAAVAEAGRHPLGSKENPVRTAMPAGERAYLARLRCTDGAAPSYERQGSGGGGPYGNILDFYQVTCAGAEPVPVVMDMYHAGYVEDRPVPGFTIVPR